MTRFVPRMLRGQRSAAAARTRRSGAGPEDTPPVTSAAAAMESTDDQESERRPSPRPKPAVDRPGEGAAPPRPRPADPGAPARGRTVRPGRKVVAAPRTGSNRRIQAAEAAVVRLRRTAVALVAWILVSGLLGGTAWYFKHQGDIVETARRDALAAAEPAAEAIFSYDYRAFDESVANGRDFVTGKFAGEYARTTASLEAAVKKEKAVIRARVSAKGVGEVAADRVEVLLFVNQYRRNVNITGEKVDENRVVLTMVHVVGRRGGSDWLVAEVVAI